MFLFDKDCLCLDFENQKSAVPSSFLSMYLVFWFIRFFFCQATSYVHACLIGKWQLSLRFEMVAEKKKVKQVIAENKKTFFHFNLDWSCSGGYFNALTDGKERWTNGHN